MKVALLHSQENNEIAHSLGKIITDANCSVNFFNSKNIWNTELCANPLLVLENVSHLLYVCSSDVSDFQTFLFFAGLALGKGIRIIVIETEHVYRFPENTRHLGVFLELESFERFFMVEISRYREEDKKIQARSVLLERGISCFDENFVLIVTSGDAEAVGLFLEAGFSASLTDSRGTPLLSLAVRAQFPTVVSLLLKSGADVNRLSLDRGYSPLMDAVQKGDVAIAEILLNNGADGNLKSKDGQTALVIAAGRGDIALCTLLVSHGSDPSIKDSLGMSATSYAALFKNEKLLSLFNMSLT